MLCYQCGSPVAPDASTCPNCGADLSRVSRRVELPPTKNIERLTQRMRAIDPSAPQRYFEEGARLSDRFVLGDLIGLGPFGQVFTASDEELDVSCAIKVLDAALVTQESRRARFATQIKRARSLTDPRVVRVHQQGTHEDHVFVSMQHLQGLTLDKLLALRASKGGHFEIDEILPIFSQLFEALDAIHGSFVHGDLKPHNVLVLQGAIKVTDYFLLSALPRTEIASRLKDSLHAAPEIKRGAEGALDPRADIYSLGVLLAQMCFGQTSLQDLDEGALDAPRAAIAALCKRAMSPEPDDRFDTLDAMKVALQTAARGESVQELGAEVSSPPPLPTPPALGLEEASSPPPLPATKPPAPPTEPPEHDSPQEPVDALVGPTKKEVDVEHMPGDRGFGSIDDLPEDEIATVEVSRSGYPELGDLLPTNDLDRHTLSRPKKADKHASARAASSRIDKEKVDQRLTQEEEARVAPAPPAARPEPDAPSSKKILRIVAALAVVGIVAALVISSNRSPKVVHIGDQGDASPNNAVASSDPIAAASTIVPATTPRDASPAIGQARQGLGAAVQNAAVALPTEATATVPVEATTAALPAVVNAPTQGDKPPTTPAANVSAPSAPAVSVKRPTTVPKATPAAQEVPAAATSCPQRMALIKLSSGNVCIDRYEYPGPGTPKTRVSWFQAKKACESDSKRLCERSEWRAACGGKYPWGSSWDATKCNTQDEDGFERSLRATGATKSCRSRSGAYDMVGNVLEWTLDKRIVGGSYNSDEAVASCGYSSGKSPSSSSADIGFRCCADPR